MVPTNEVIAVQKTTAKKVLDLLRVIDPYCILAGGAPRNWYLGETARDLDFYYTCDRSCITMRLGILLRESPVSRLNERTYESQLIKDVHRTVVDGLEIDLVRVASTFKVLDSFSTSISRMWWKGGAIRATEEALESIKTKTVLFDTTSHVGSMKHVLKMKDKYPTYRFVQAQGCKFR